MYLYLSSSTFCYVASLGHRCRIGESHSVHASQILTPSPCDLVWLFRLARFLSLTYFRTGAGCVWNDILDRNFDRQVGKLASYFLQ
jgi:hypothetical protein